MIQNFKHHHIRLTNALILSVLFVLWPFGAFLLSLRTFSQRFSRFIFVLFWGVWGYSRRLILEHDATDWTFQFIGLTDKSFAEFVELHILTLGETSTDFLMSLFAFGISRITESTTLFWLIHGILFSFIYVKSYPNFLKFSIPQKSGLIVLFLIFILFIPLTAYGVRFWYAAIVYIYAVVQIIIYQKKKFRVLLLVAPLIHFSFILMLMLYLYYELTKNNQKFYLLILLFFGMFFNIIGLSSLINILSGLNAFQSKLDSYGNITGRISYFKGKSIFLLMDRFIYSFYSLFIVVFFKTTKYIKLDKKNFGISNFGYFLLVFMGALIFMLPFLDALDRFFIVFSILTILYFTHIYVINQNSYIINNLFLFGVAFWGVHIAVNLIRSRTSIDPALLYDNLFSLLSKGTDVPIIY